MGDEDYSDLQNPSGGYGASQQPGTLYAGSGAAGSPPASGTGGSAKTPKVGAAKSTIQVSVNPASKIRLADMVALLNKTPGIVPEFKNKIKLDTKAKLMSVPDYSQNPVVPGKEWIFDVGKAGNDWEVTTGILSFRLEFVTYSRLEEDIGNDEERGHPSKDDPDESLMRPSRDFTGALQRGLMLGLTIPNSAMIAKNPPDPKVVPQPQIARLESGKGLIILARQIIVGEGQKAAKAIPVPKALIARAFFHELSAHACFFAQGLDAAHGTDLVERNFKQAEESYNKVAAKEIAGLLQKVQAAIDAVLAKP